MVADLLSPDRCHWWIAKVKNYKLNVTEVQDSDFKNGKMQNKFPDNDNFSIVHWLLRFMLVPMV